MANHASARKRIRSSEAKHARNRYQWKACKLAIRDLKKAKEKDQATTIFNQLTAMLDKAANRCIIHQNKAARLKSYLSHYVQTL